MLSKLHPPESLREHQVGIAWVLDPSALSVGDVIVSTGDNIVSFGIRIATRSAVSHAAIHVGGGFVIEAVEGGVRRIHVRSLVFPSNEYIHVLRPVEASEAQLQLASEHARSLLYRPYSVRGAVGTVAPFCRASEDPGRFCSQVVSESLKLAGLPHVNKSAEEVTPADLLGSHLLKPVEGSKRGVAKSAIMHALSEMQPTWTLERRRSEERQITAERFEEVARLAAEQAMQRYSCFTRPYHLFDALRQIVAVFSTYPKAASEVDAALVEVIKIHQAALGNGVEPRSTIPGIIDSTPDPNLILMVEARDDVEAAEVVRLHAELLVGREWDEREWRRTTDEIELKYKETALSSLLGTELWLLRDWARVQATYRWLAMEN